MYNITDISTLGKSYSIVDKDEKFIKAIRIIPHTEILNAALGEFDESFVSMGDYLEESIATLSGYDAIDPDKIYWLTTENETVPLEDILETAIVNDYDVIILEKIDV